MAYNVILMQGTGKKECNCKLECAIEDHAGHEQHQHPSFYLTYCVISIQAPELYIELVVDLVQAMQ